MQYISHFTTKRSKERRALIGRGSYASSGFREFSHEERTQQSRNAVLLVSKNGGLLRLLPLFSKLSIISL
jgi:hypothetical protein